MRLGIALVVLVACGGDGPAPGPGPLVEDPAVELGCRSGPVAGTRAKRVACAGELVGGRLAAGRVGDFVIENANLRVIVRGPGEGYYQHGSSGGGIVDAARVGGEDLVKELLPAIDLSAGAFDEMVIVEAGDDGDAELVVRGPATGLDIIQAALGREVPPVIVEHHYRLAAGAHALTLETRVFPQPGSERAPHELYDALFFGGRAPAFVPGRGFDVGTGGAEIIATAGTTTSYGLVYPAGTPDPQLIDLAGIRLALATANADDAGLTRFLVVGDGSVASVTEQAWLLRGVELGAIDGTTAPDVDVVVRQAGTPITVARADASGAFHVAVPIGEYTLRAESRFRAPGADVDAVAPALAPVAVPAGPSGALAVQARDGDALAIPVRVVLTPQAGDERIEYLDATGSGVFSVPPGTWRVAVSRGLEYEAFVATNVVIADGGTQTVAATLPRVVDTAGWISLDTHLHSELSTDSTFPIDDRLRAVAAEGVEVPVSTDHDIIVDYAPIIAELGLGAWLGTLAGEEASSIVFGHINGYPLAIDPARTGGGAVHWYAKSPGDVFAVLHASTPSTIVQVNHPRRGTSSLFDAIDLDPDTLSARRDPVALGLPPGTDLSDLRFDAVEVANGESRDDFDEVFGDYTALVAAGHAAAATGASDSHGAGKFAGEARTYVFVGTDSPATVDPAVIVAAIHARHVTVGTGAFVTAGIVTAAGTSLPGDRVDVTGLPQVTLHVKVQAASWQPLARVRIFAGKQEIRTIELDPNATAPVRFEADVVVPTPARTTAWIVRVDPAGPGEPVLDDPMPAFTNPLVGVIQ